MYVIILFVLFLLEGEGVVILAGLAVPHQVAGFLTQPEKRLCVCSTDRSVVPAAVNNEKKKGRRMEELKKRS